MTKKMGALFLIVALILLMIAGCNSGENKYVGAWVPVESATAPSGFPDKMVLRDDYTGSVDGISVNWATHDGGFSITASNYGTTAYSAQFDGDNLILTLKSKSVEYCKQK